MLKRSLIYGCIFWAALASAQAVEPPPEMGQRPKSVSVQKIDGGHIYADAKGMALYTFDQDATTPGTSSCTLHRHCQVRWPPLYAAESDQPVGDWTIIKRQDGKAQWAYKGKPVYTYLDDLTPGSISGDNGGGGRWHALAMWMQAPTPVVPPGIQVKRKGDAWFFADFEGREIHAPVKKCDAACLRTWRPLRASAMAQAVGKWSVLERDDGYRQWAYDGVGLYVPRDTLTITASNDWKPVEVR